MEERAKLIDVVALTAPRRSDEGVKLVRGQVGTIVETLAEHVFLVEFSDHTGEAYAFAAVPDEELMVLHHQLVAEPVES